MHSFLLVRDVWQFDKYRWYSFLKLNESSREVLDKDPTDLGCKILSSSKLNIFDVFL